MCSLQQPLRNLRKGAWTREEDILLTVCIEKYGEGKWRQVPIRAGLRRCRKSCRLRWLNYLRPGIKRGEFAEDELDLIIRLHRLLGNRWSLIAGRLPGRTANDIKNYWNAHLCKKLLLVKRGLDEKKSNNSNKEFEGKKKSKNRKKKKKKSDSNKVSEGKIKKIEAEEKKAMPAIIIIKPQPRRLTPNICTPHESIPSTTGEHQDQLLAHTTDRDDDFSWWKAILAGIDEVGDDGAVGSSSNSRSAMEELADDQLGAEIMCGGMDAMTGEAAVEWEKLVMDPAGLC